MVIKSDVSARKEPTQERARFTVEAVLTAAAQLLENVGFDRATTNRIAERAGVSIGSLYQYFPNKESLTEALIERQVEKHADRFAKKIAEYDGRPVQELISNVTRDMVAMYLDNLKMLRILARLVPKINVIPCVIKNRANAVSVLAGAMKKRQHELKCADCDLAAFLIVTRSWE